jgi:hypothetical protein
MHAASLLSLLAAVSYCPLSCLWAAKVFMTCDAGAAVFNVDSDDWFTFISNTDTNMINTEACNVACELSSLAL